MCGDSRYADRGGDGGVGVDGSCTAKQGAVWGCGEWDGEVAVIIMTTKYDQIRHIYDFARETNDTNGFQIIPSLLESWGRKCRPVDELLWVNLSHPMTVEEAISIGLRYKKKKDGMLTEDIFELEKDAPDKLTPYYKGNYQTLRPEYRGTHKFQDVATRSFASVNSCCLYLKE